MKIRRRFAALVLATSLLAVAIPVLSQPNTGNQPGTSTEGVSRQERMREHIQARLNRMAERLKLEPAQQDAWAAYAKTVEAMVGTGLAKPATDADAAALVRFRAQLAAEHAQKLNQLADATVTLQQALNPEQHEILKDLVRHPRETARGRAQPMPQAPRQ